MRTPRVLIPAVTALPLAIAQPKQTIPFVGCPADGQIGPIAAPKGTKITLPIRAEAARHLAYYRAFDIGVLAPRGWHCFGLLGSGGKRLSVEPRKPDWDTVRAGAPDGPAVVLIRRFSGTSGRWSVATTIARVFPAHREFVHQVADMFFEPRDKYPTGPYPADTLVYRSDRAVRYTTPAGAAGLGTEHLATNASPIRGSVMLAGRQRDLLHLAVRLPAGQEALSILIVEQLEREAARLP